MIVTLLAKTQLYELTIIAAYGDMSDYDNYYRPVVPKLLIIVYTYAGNGKSTLFPPTKTSLLNEHRMVLDYVLLISYRLF